jgi:protocatechuate 3,4-dioxygenase beta subunit
LNHSLRGCAALLAGVLALAAWAETQSPATPEAPPKAKVAAPARKAPKPPPVTSLDVTVTDSAGRPVEGAFVVALPAQGAYRPFGGLATEKVRSTLTGREGKAKLESLPPGPWNVTVRARGFVTQPLRRVASGPLAVRLEKGGAITGVVREGRTSRPVPGARVSVPAGIPATGGWDEEATRNETTTDAQGRFRLDGIGRKPANLVVRAPGFDQAGSEARQGESVEIFLFPGATLAGTVRDDEGRPVKGAAVRAESDRSRIAPPIERTDARGEFLVPGVRPGQYTVVAREGGRAPGIAAVVVEPEAEARVEVLLSDGGFVTGRVVDPEGRPLAGRLRLEVVDEHGLPASASDRIAADAKADGAFVLGPVPLGTLGISVSAPGHATRRVDATVARRAAVDLGDVVLETGLVIRGRVRDREGNGLAGASVRARLRRPGERSLNEATSEADGEYVVAGLGPGTYQLTAVLPGHATAQATALAGGDPVDLVMDAGGEIAGRVVDAAGQPAEDATLAAEWADEAEAGSPGGAFGAAEEGEGRFVLRDLAAGAYVVQARAAGKGEASISGVRVVAGRRTEVGTLRLAAGGIVRGTVVDVDGQGVPGATVVAERDLMMQSGDLVDQTGSSGTFEISGVPAGRVSVMASHPAYASPKPVVVEVDPEKEPAPIRIVLLEGARVEGRALHRDGRPFASGRILLSSLEPGAEGIGIEPSPVRPDGSFVIDHMGAGRTRIELLAPSAPGALSGLASREVVLRDGETATVDFSLRDVVVAGTVTRGGQPAPGVRVSLMSLEGAPVTLYMGVAARAHEAPSGPPFLVATTREDGSYELVVFTPGRARVSLEAAAGRERYPGREVQVPDVDRFELDLEIAETQVSGTVVDKDGGEPIAEASVRIRRSSARTGPDGRFTLAVEPGEWRLEADAPGRKRTVLPLSVGPAGLSDVRVEMERGVELRGRVVDIAGRPAPNLEVVAADAMGDFAGSVYTLADGSFRMGSLGEEPYTLVTGGDLMGWAVRGGVTPGGDAVTLVLRPGGRIALRVLGPDGRPVEHAYPEVLRVDGLRVVMPGGWGSTDANGFVEIGAPAGRLEVEADSREGTGRGAVSVPAGATVPLEIPVSPRKPNGPGSTPHNG